MKREGNDERGRERIRSGERRSKENSVGVLLPSEHAL